MHKYFLLLILSMLIGSATVSAQKYGNALGLRADGQTLGILYKHRVMDTHTVDGLLAFNSYESYLKGSYNIHKKILSKSLNYYVGAGGHIGRHEISGGYVGADLTLGLEFKLPVLPVLAAVDVNPAFHIGREDNVQILTGLSVLYVINTERDVRKSKRAKKSIFRRS